MRRRFITTYRIFCLVLSWIFLINTSANAQIQEPALEKNIPENSLYLFKADWTNQDNESIKLEEFRGQTVFIAMIYTHCLQSCPIIVSSLQALEKELNKKQDNKINKNSEKNKIHFILVSLTPKSDTHEVLKEFAQKRKLNEENWTLLTGKESDAHTLSMMLNIKYSEIKTDSNETELAHSNFFTALDANGVILFNEAGNASGIKKAVEKLGL